LSMREKGKKTRGTSRQKKKNKMTADERKKVDAPAQSSVWIASKITLVHR
jgi:hypothetical protein